MCNMAEGGVKRTATKHQKPRHRPAPPHRHPFLSLAGRLQVPVDALRLAGLEPKTEDRVEQRLDRWPKAAASGGVRYAPERRRSLSRKRRGVGAGGAPLGSSLEGSPEQAGGLRAGLWSGGWAAAGCCGPDHCAHAVTGRMRAWLQAAARAAAPCPLRWS